MEIELMGGYYEIWYETVWSDSLIWKSSSPVDMISDSFSQSMLAGGLARTTHRIWKKMIDWKKRRFLMFYSSMCIYISCAKPYNLDWDLRIDFLGHLSMWSRLRIIISWIHETKTHIRYISYFQTMHCIDDYLGYMLLYNLRLRWLTHWKLQYPQWPGSAGLRHRQQSTCKGW